MMIWLDLPGTPTVSPPIHTRPHTCTVCDARPRGLDPSRKGC